MIIYYKQCLLKSEETKAEDIERKVSEEKSKSMP